MKLTEADRHMVEDNLELVDYVIHRKCGNISKADYEDLHQTGVIGLCKAAAKYNNALGASFATFAVRCIINEIYMTFRRQKKQSKLHIVSLDESVYTHKDGNEMTLSDVLCDIEDAETMLLHQSLKEMLDKRFDERDTLIVRMHLLGVCQQDIADKVGISQAQVSRRIKRIREIVLQEHCGAA